MFEDVSFLTNERDRIGLTGKNGAGKSTLLKILASIQQPDKGTFSGPNAFTFGYLPQEIKYQSENTVFNEAALSFIVNCNYWKKK